MSRPRTRTMIAFAAPFAFASVVLLSGAPTRADDPDDDDDVVVELDAKIAAQHAKQAAKHAKQAAKDAAKHARKQLDHARQQVSSDQSLPPALRAAALRRIEAAMRVLDKRVGSIKIDGDWEAFEDQMEAMGEELEEQFEGLEEELENLGPQIEAAVKRGLMRKFGGAGGAVVVPTPPMPPMPPMPPTPPTPHVAPVPPVPPVAGPLDDMDMAIDLDDLGLRPDQRDALRRIVAEEKRVSDPAEQRLAGLSEQLRGALDAPAIDNRTVDNLVDRMSGEEAIIRKAQLRAWAASRRVLDDGQRQQVEDAARDRRRHRRGRGR